MLNAVESKARVDELDRRVGDVSTVGPTTLRQLKRNTENNTEWWMCTTSPVSLHRDAGLDRDTYACARCISSEIDEKGPGATLLAIAECLRNSAKRDGTGVYQICNWRTTDDYSWTQGWYGEQHGRKVSTSRDPKARCVLAARMALQENTDYWNGAERWFDPKTQDGGQQGTHALQYDAIGIAEKWGAEGWQWVGHVPNVNPYNLAVLKKVSKPVNNADLVAVIRASRAGSNMTPATAPGTPPIQLPENVKDPVAENNAAVANEVAKRGFPWWMIALGLVAAYEVTR